MKAAESFMEEMKSTESARYDCSVYKTDKEIDRRGR